MGARRRPLPRRPPPTTAAWPPRGAGQAILVIEPHPPLAELIGEALRDEGYRPVLAASLPEAVAHLSAERFALVLADPLRPEYASTGMLTRPWSHLEAIRALAADTPIVICTAYSAWAFADYRRRGFRDLLLKPFTLRDLLAAVRRNLAHEDPNPAAPQGGLEAPPPAAEWRPASPGVDRRVPCNPATLPHVRPQAAWARRAPARPEHAVAPRDVRTGRGGLSAGGR